MMLFNCVSSSDCTVFPGLGCMYKTAHAAYDNEHRKIQVKTTRERKDKDKESDR